MLYTIIVIIIAIICLFLTLAILVQSNDGSGLSGMAGGSSSQMMGTRRTSDILSKSTTVLGGAFLLLCLLANFAIDKKQVSRSAVQSTVPGLNNPIDFSQPTSSESTLPADTSSN